MSSSISCLLCGYHELRSVQRMRAETLEGAYRDQLGIACALRVGELEYQQCKRCELLFFTPPVTGDEHFYASLQRISWYYSADKQEFRLAAAYVSGQHDVLEIGAGRGLFAKAITARSYTGLELSPDAIRRAADDGIALSAETIEAHAVRYPERYDVVCAFQVLEHVADPRSFLEAAKACLKPGGRLIISVPGEDSFARHAYWDVLNMPPHHVTRWTDACLRSVAQLCGLALVALTPEPLGKNMVKFRAHSVADHAVAKWFHMEPELLDRRLKRPLFRVVANAVASVVRPYLKLRRHTRRGHAVMAVFEK